MALSQSKTLNVSINADPKKVYDFVSDPENMPNWAGAFCQSVGKVRGEWVIKTPEGPMRIRFCQKNEFGILDHFVSPAPGAEIFVPMRVVPNGSGSEIIFTLFRMPDMTDEKFTEDIKWVRRDLESLKTVLEKS